jgi:Recombinase
MRGSLPRLCQEVRKASAGTLREIAEALNARGISTPRGTKCKWYAASVRNVLARAGSFATLLGWAAVAFLPPLVIEIAAGVVIGGLIPNVLTRRP